MEWRSMGEDAYCVRIERGEEVIEQLTAFATERGISAGSVSGIGAVMDSELGYYELETKIYHRRPFPEDHELLSLIGNFSRVEGKPYVHAHVTLGGADFKVVGGHLFKAVVAVTVELIVRPLAGEVDRRLDETCGLNLWNLAQGDSAS